MSIFGSINSVLNQINKVLDPIMKSQGFQGLGTVTITGRQGEDEKRKAFPQFNPFRAYVMLELLRRKKQFPTMPTIPFVRMTSTNVDNNAGYKFFSLGLHGFDAKEQNIFDLTYSADGNDVVGTAISTSSKHRRTVITSEISAGPEGKQASEQFAKSIVADARPTPGITAVNIKRSGLGQPLLASVQWVCYNRAQLEFLRNHFLIPGNYVVLEIGQNFADKPVQKMFDFTDDKAFEELKTIVGATTTSTGLAEQSGREYVIKNYSKPNDGNYDLIVGQIGNFEITYEPETTTYKCTTSIVSQGENVWGIKFDQTSVALEDHVPGEISTIKDYFLNGLYDSFLNKELSEDEFVSRGHGGVAGFRGIIKEKNYIEGSAELQESAKTNNVSVNPTDYMYLSWEKVFGSGDSGTSLLVDMFAVIKDEGIRNQLIEFLTLDTLAKKKEDDTRRDYDRAGYHQGLISCEPESLLLINKTSEAYWGTNPSDKLKAAVETAKTVYKAGGEFGPSDGDGEHEASLEKGVWINSGMIRECFMGASDLKQALSSVLMCLNRATANYWQLQLYHDELTGKYRIIDYKSGDQAREESFYKFNVGPGVKSIMGDITSGGECLSVEFDSAFPPELISQMMLMAKFKASSPKEQADIIKKYPLVNSTSAHVFVLNWSNMTDGLAEEIKKWREGVKKTPVEHQTAAQNDGAGQAMSAGKGVASQGATRSEGEKAGDTTPVPADAAAPPPMKTDTDAVPEPYRLQTSPIKISPLPVSSVYGPRVNTTTGVVRPHKGIDIAVPVGTAVYATNTGIIEKMGYNINPDGFGTYIEIRHTNDQDYSSVYGHLSVLNQNLQLRGPVNAGTLLGYSGGEKGTVGAGISEGPHLHYELRKRNILGIGKGDPRQLESLGQVAVLKGTNEKAELAILNTKQSSTTAMGNIATPTNPRGTDPSAEIQLRESDMKAAELRRAEVTAKFGSNVLVLTEMNRSDMIHRITLDGYNNTNKPNSYVSPYPTTTSVGVEIMGIAGISVSDGFFVDRIPFTFEQHGVFQVVEVTDDVSPKGWRTKVRGYFKMLWYDANGQSTAIF